jgi:hypothetical protein
MYVVRFTNRHAPGFTYLQHHHGVLRVGVGGAKARAVTEEEAAKFGSIAAAHTALGEFICKRGGLKDSDWCGEPEVVLLIDARLLWITERCGSVIALYRRGSGFVVLHSGQSFELSTLSLALDEIECGIVRALTSPDN